MRPAVYLRVGHNQRVLGQIFEPEDLPELLRHVADYYDDNPDDCAELFNASSGTSLSTGNLLNPFAVSPEQ